jgi:uncharacterized membrane protein
MFSAIIILLAFTPVGFIQLPFIKATIIHIPVIIGAIILNSRMGAGLGFIFGLTSLINNTYYPTVSSFVFSPFIPVPGTDSGSLYALLVCFVPRILVGVVPWFIYRLLQKATNNRFDTVNLIISGIAGSMTNTFLVMYFIYFLFKDAYAYVQGILPNAVHGFITTIIIVNGIPEAIAAGIFTAAICKAMFASRSKL